MPTKLPPVTRNLLIANILVFALQYPWQDDLKHRFVPLVLTVLAMSVLVHGVTATPLMERYYRRRERKESA